MSIEERTEEAVTYLKKVLRFIPQSMVAFSGGKDSIVIAKLMQFAELPHILVYEATGIDPPEMPRFIRKHYPNTQFVRPKETFWKMIVTKNPPLPGVRWCCDHLKKQPAATIRISYRVLGIRAEESFRRANYNRLDIPERFKWQRLVYPIFHWKEYDVWDFIEKHNLPYPSLYDDGADRIGCVVCPFMNKKKHEWARDKWPGMYISFERSVHRWYNHRKAQGRGMCHDSADLFLADWYQNKARWFK